MYIYIYLYILIFIYINISSYIYIQNHMGSMESMYIYLYKNHKNQPDVGKYTIHGPGSSSVETFRRFSDTNSLMHSKRTRFRISTVHKHTHTHRKNKTNLRTYAGLGDIHCRIDLIFVLAAYLDLLFNHLHINICVHYIYISLYIYIT